MSSLARKYQQQPLKPLKQKQEKKIVQKNKSKITKGEKGLILLFLLVLAIVGSIVIANYATMYAYNRDIHNLERAIVQQTEVNESLKLQVTELSAPDRILSIATEQLGMTLEDNNIKVIQN